MKPTQEQVIAWAREAGIPETATEGVFIANSDDLGRLIAAEREDEREKIVQWMIQRSYATGHGDTTEDLLAELEWQVREAERNNMVATAAELGWALYGGDPFEDGVRDVAAIRAREQK